MLCVRTVKQSWGGCTNMPPKTVKSKLKKTQSLYPNNFINYPNNLICRYKEGRVILEQALISESEGFPDPYSTPPTANHRYSNQNHYQD